jgi:hypothetical protein
VRGCTFSYDLSIDVPFNLCGFDELVVFVNLYLSIDVPFYFYGFEVVVFVKIDLSIDVPSYLNFYIFCVVQF